MRRLVKKKTPPPPPPISPPWDPRTKRLIAIVLLVLVLLAIYMVRSLLIPLILSLVVAYVVKPLVDLIHRRARLPRTAALGIVYLTIIAALIALPALAIPQIIKEINNIINNTPRYIEQLGALLSQSIVIGDYEIHLEQFPIVEQAYAALSSNLIDIVRTISGQSFALLGNVATATLGTIFWILVVLFVSFYMVKDYRILVSSVVDLVPADYQEDMYRLGYEISATWHAFLRGQLMLSMIVGTAIFLMATIIGLPNALLLALTAALLEFIPTLGPILSAVPAILIALLQSNASWLGAQMGPFWFAILVLILYTIIQQLEGWLLIPRIIGRSVNLHPMVVLMGAIAGASIAGILGVLLAAPVLATARLVFLYIYYKLTDQPPFPHIYAITAEPVTAEQLPEETEEEEKSEQESEAKRKMIHEPDKSAPSPTTG